MTSALARITPSPNAALALPILVHDAREYLDAARAPSTRRAYRTSCAQFEAWCADHAVSALPASPETVVLYVTYLAREGLAVATIERALAALAWAHKSEGFPSPRTTGLVADTMRGLRRLKGVAPVQKAPVCAEHVTTMAEGAAETVVGVRDRALLVLGFAGAFRRSELVSLDVRDLRFTGEGLEVTLRRSKTDQEGVGRTIGIPYAGNPATCPVRAVQAWMAVAEIETGPLFRAVHRTGSVRKKRLSDRAVALIVKRHGALIGMNARDVSGHSLRAGFCTSAAKAGKTERAIMNQTGQKSVTVVRRYIRNASLFTDNAAAGLL